ncbi:MAG: nucleotidyltransferase domain-containing protein [Bacteroidales bacterium]|nr:nucleotidyltransferase domain-containing protein [Bacteroidales bacterium]MCF8391622.1 nucleotidyltransferase domain-containing protein [Bacteroidales bacterium]
MKLIQKHIKNIISLCKKHHVEDIYVFGSIVTDHFNQTSDIDFLVRFSGVEPLEYFDNYMDFKEGLESLLSRSVDLIEVQTLKNPILKRSINRNKRLIYGREDSKMAV